MGVAVEPQRLQLRRRVQDAGEGFAAVAGTLAIVVAGALVIAALVLGIVLSLVWIGLPLVLAALAACQLLAETHRRQANRLLGAHLPPLDVPERRGDSLWRRTLYALTDRRRLRGVGVVALDLPVGAVLLLAALLPMAVTVELAILGVSALLGLGEYDFVGPLTLTAPAGVLLLALALAAAVVTIAILGGLRLVVRSYSRAVLGHRAGKEVPIRLLLAVRVCYRTLSIAYGLPDRD
jgi:hypothetical protein